MPRQLRFLIPIVGLLCAPIASLHAQADSSAAQPVYSGVYLMNLYDLDVNEYSFYADFYVWFRWQGERDPMNIEFVNALEKWGFTITPFTEEAQLLDDGSYYNGMRIEGRFYHSFELARFPLDAHQLEIRIENVDFTADSLVYVPDTMTHLVRPDFMIPGWAITDARMEANTNFYATSFGDPQDRGSSYSNFTFSLTITRPASYFLLKLMLPLLVVIMASLGALFIAPTYVDARFSLPIGGLLSCVFLQQSYSSALPDVGYMVLMDKIYLLSYLLIGLIMLRVLLASNALAHDTSADHRAVRRQDRRLWWSLTALYLLGIGILLIVS